MGVALVVLSIVAFGVVIGVAQKRAADRRRVWFEAARAALGPGFGEFARSDDFPHALVSAGELEGESARVVADESFVWASLHRPCPKGVDRQAVFDMIVRGARGSLELDRDALAAFDDEHGSIIIKVPVRGEPKPVVDELLSLARSFRESLPERLAAYTASQREAQGKIFGALTGEDGRHKLLGLSLALSPDEWELLGASRDGALTWERIPQESDADDHPEELKLMAAPQDAALSDASARVRLVGLIANASVERLPDGAFEDAAPEVSPRSIEPVATFPAAEAVIDHRRDVAVAEDRTERIAYRQVIRAVFAPWAVAVFELTAPEARTLDRLARVLAQARFEAPSAGAGLSAGPEKR